MQRGTKSSTKKAVGLHPRCIMFDCFLVLSQFRIFPIAVVCFCFLYGESRKTRDALYKEQCLRQQAETALLSTEELRQQEVWCSEICSCVAHPTLRIDKVGSAAFCAVLHHVRVILGGQCPLIGRDEGWCCVSPRSWMHSYLAMTVLVPPEIAAVSQRDSSP